VSSRRTEFGVRLVIILALGVGLPAAALADCLSSCPTRKGAFGSPEVDRACALKCLQEDDAAPPPKAQPAAKPKPRAAEWPADWQQQIRRMIGKVPDPAFRDWAAANVELVRRDLGEGSWTLGVVPGKLIVYKSFWDPQLDEDDRQNVLVFELAKLLWFARVNAGPREVKTAREREFEAIYWRHPAAIEATRLAAWGEGERRSLGYLTDRDMQSWFSYALRAVIYRLAPPPGPASVRADWQAALAEVRAFYAALLRQ